MVESRSLKGLADRLFERAYTDFGVAPPAGADRWSYCTTVAAALLYVACMGIFWLTLNVATLFFGVFVEPLWQPNAKFRRLKLPNGIPLIGLFMPVLLVIVGYNAYRMHGVLFAIGPYILIALAGLLIIAGFVVFNLLRRRLARVPPRRAGS